MFLTNIPNITGLLIIHGVLWRISLDVGGWNVFPTRSVLLTGSVPPWLQSQVDIDTSEEVEIFITEAEGKPIVIAWTWRFDDSAFWTQFTLIKRGSEKNIWKAVFFCLSDGWLHFQSGDGIGSPPLVARWFCKDSLRSRPMNWGVDIFHSLALRLNLWWSKVVKWQPTCQTR